jgi:hypothetical protein
VTRGRGRGAFAEEGRLPRPVFRGHRVIGLCRRKGEVIRPRPTVQEGLFPRPLAPLGREGVGSVDRVSDPGGKPAGVIGPSGRVDVSSPGWVRVRL